MLSVWNVLMRQEPFLQENRHYFQPVVRRLSKTSKYRLGAGVQGRRGGGAVSPYEMWVGVPAQKFGVRIHPLSPNTALRLAGCRGHTILPPFLPPSIFPAFLLPSILLLLTS